MKKLLRYLMLSAGLYCQPPEDIESKCEGEVLFEDEFDGSELDEGKWSGEPCGRDYYNINDGIMELTGGANGGCGLQSRSTYTLDDRTLCFEARWKVREREGAAFVVDLYNQKDLGIIGFEEYNGELNCFANAGNLDTRPCNTDTTDFHSTKIELNTNKSIFYIDERQVGILNTRLRGDIGYVIDLSCSSENNSEKSCLIDYVRLRSQ